MPKTYNYLPFDVSDIFRAIVATVNDNLVSETSLDIPRVTYKAETWNELCARLKADSEGDNTRKSSRYPMVALIRNYDYSNQRNSTYTDTTLTLVIVTQTTFDKLSEDRQAENYQPILYPIYSELMEQIALCRYFQGPYDPWPTHKAAESFNLSKDNNNAAVVLPDYCDAIIITGLQLKINQQMVAGFAYGASKALIYLNNVNSLTLEAGVSDITITLIDANYVDTLAVGQPEYNVFIPTSQSGGEYVQYSIGIGGHVAYQFEPGFEDGNYTGYIECNDGVTQSRLYFFFELQDGVVIKYTSSNEFTLEDFSLGGFDYPNYPFQTSVRTKTNKAIISRIDMSSDGGNALGDTVYFTPHTNDTETVSTDQYLEAPTSYRDVICQVTLSGNDVDIPLESISYYKLT